MTERFNHRLPVDGPRPRRVLNIERANAALRSHCISTLPVATVAGLAYVEIHGANPELVMGYGVDHRGPWARVGDSRARAQTPAAALQAALAAHKGAAGG